MYSVASTTGNRGIYVPAHGSGSAKSVFVVDTNNNVTFNGSLNGTASTATTVSYTTTAPTAANSSGLKFAVLTSSPATKYNGWVYLIKE